LLIEIPGNSTTFLDAQKIVDRMAFDALELLPSYVRLVDPDLARAITVETERV
jgi:hypothetical protein